MKILFIEDRIITIRGIVDYIEEKDGWDYKNSTFEDALSNLIEYDPDLVVLDWMYDAGQDSDEGKPIFDLIYERNFIPLIVYSAIASALPYEMTSISNDNPMIEIMSKGNEQEIIKKIEQWEPYIHAVKQSKKELNDALLCSARAMAYYFHIGGIDTDIVKYMLRKRIHSYFPQIEDEDIKAMPPAWIEYEYPPMSKSLMVADIIRKDSGDNSSVAKAKCYYVVLTPSCDMERGDADDYILVAKCEGAGSLYKVGSNEGVTERTKGDVIRYINTGYNYAKVPLPELPNKIPYMTVNLKRLERIKLGEIALDEKTIEKETYYRVASLSSPFRENLVWAHMINSCRPGMPDRDIDTWAESIVGEP